MTDILRAFLRPAALAFFTAVAIAAFIAPSAAVERQQAPKVPLLAGPPGELTFIQPAPATVPQPEAATFVVTYTGFSPAARAAFQRAVNIWAGRLTSPVPITISAQFQPLGANVLGQAGPNFFWRNFPGAPVAGTWYVDALANKRHGAQLDPSPDIVAQFNSSFPNWHFGAGPAPAGKYDFTSVVLHEIGHGLGFLGLGNVSAGRGSVRALGAPSIYDRFTENASGKKMLSFAGNSVALATALQGGHFYFDSAAVRAANGNVRARLYAPNPFQPGSSYSHFSEASYPRGNANSLMTPVLGQAETIRSPGPLAMAVFTTLGW